MDIDHASFLFDVEARLRQWTARIAGLEQRLGRDREGRAPRSQRIESLVQKRNTLANKVEKLRQCSDGRWRDVAREIRRSVEEVEDAWRCVFSPRNDGPGSAVAPSAFEREEGGPVTRG